MLAGRPSFPMRAAAVHHARKGRQRACEQATSKGRGSRGRGVDAAPYRRGKAHTRHGRVPLQVGVALPGRYSLPNDPSMLPQTSCATAWPPHGRIRNSTVADRWARCLSGPIFRAGSCSRALLRHLRPNLNGDRLGSAAGDVDGLARELAPLDVCPFRVSG